MMANSSAPMYSMRHFSSDLLLPLSSHIQHQLLRKSILLNYFKELGWVGDNIDTLCQHLVDWADIIRKTYYDGGVEDIITTRRLVNVVKAYAIWDDY